MDGRMDGQRVRMGEGRGTEPAMGLMAEAEAATGRDYGWLPDPALPQ